MKNRKNMKIILISCVSKKKQINEGETLPAKDLYISTLFKKAWSYANKLNPDTDDKIISI